MIEQAQAQIDVLNAANLERFPETKEILQSAGFHSIVTRLQDHLVRDARSTLYFLWGGALFLLLIGCANVASLALVRARVRLKEVAVRLALGARRWQIVRPFVIEHLLLTTASGIGGILIGSAVLSAFGAASEALPRGAEIVLDATIVVYTMAISVLIGLLLGLIPVPSGLAFNVTGALREEGRTGTSGRGTRKTHRALVVVQVAAAFMLLIGAGLLFSSFQQVLAIDPGFNPARVLTASINLPTVRYEDGDAVRRFTGDALRALRSIPGVVAAGATTIIPFGDSSNQNVMFPEGYCIEPGDSLTAAFNSVVTTGYFEPMQVRLVSGRFFDERDSADAQRVVIVDERLARRYWPDVDPVGRRMFEPSDIDDLTATNENTVWYTVVGVVAEVKLRGLVTGVSDIGAYYTAQAQTPRRNLTFTIRTVGAPMTVVTAVRGAIARADSELPLFDVRTMEERMDKSLSTRRLSMQLSTSFGLVALFLSALGIYGVLAYQVTQRTREMGIRIALGSTRLAILQLVYREGLTLVAGGLVLGLVGAAFLTRSLETEFFGVRPADPVVLAMAIAVLAGVALMACALPARRATQIDPVRALAE